MKKLEPWQIALMVVAVLLVTWRVVAYVQGQKSQVGKFEPGPYQQQASTPMPGGSTKIRERIEREK